MARTTLTTLRTVVSNCSAVVADAAAFAASLESALPSLDGVTSLCGTLEVTQGSLIPPVIFEYLSATKLAATQVPKTILGSAVNSVELLIAAANSTWFSTDEALCGCSVDFAPLGLLCPVMVSLYICLCQARAQCACLATLSP